MTNVVAVGVGYKESVWATYVFLATFFVAFLVAFPKLHRRGTSVAQSFWKEDIFSVDSVYFREYSEFLQVVKFAVGSGLQEFFKKLTLLLIG